MRWRGIKWRGIFLREEYFRTGRDVIPVAIVMRWYENTGRTHCLPGKVSRLRWISCGAVSWKWLAVVYVWKCGMWRACLFQEQARNEGNSVHVGDEVGRSGGVFHASASVSRWVKGQDGKYERATFAGFCAARCAGQQGVMAHERQARDSDRQSGANTQAIDCHGPLLEKVVTFSADGESAHIGYKRIAAGCGTQKFSGRIG